MGWEKTARLYVFGYPTVAEFYLILVALLYLILSEGDQDVFAIPPEDFLSLPS